MNFCRSIPDDIAELRGDFGDDPLIEADPLRFRFFGQRPMPRTRPADQKSAKRGRDFLMELAVSLLRAVTDPFATITAIQGTPVAWRIHWKILPLQSASVGLRATRF